MGERALIFGNKTIDKDEDGFAGNEEGGAVFNSSWLPGSDPKYLTHSLLHSQI